MSCTDDMKSTSNGFDRVLSDLITGISFRRQQCGVRDIMNIFTCALTDSDQDYVYRLSGSVSELYIDPLLPCYGDIDIMKTATRMVAIPEGGTPKFRIEDWQDTVEVFDICDTDQRGYVLLRFNAKYTFDGVRYKVNESVTSDECFLTNAVLHKQNEFIRNAVQLIAGSGGISMIDGPARVILLEINQLLKDYLYFDENSKRNTIDDVPCITCPVWPPQAADWATRYREHGWPDQVTLGLVLSNGCDVVGATHRRSREDEFLRTFQWRLSFSRAEILLLNTWTSVQQTVYHMLRFFAKSCLFTYGNISDSNGYKLMNNYHIKTLMLWSCELRPARWWNPHRLLYICSQLLKTLVEWLNVTHCRSFFIPDCNLFDFCVDGSCAASLIHLLESFSTEQLECWFMENYAPTIVKSLVKFNVQPSFDGRAPDCIDRQKTHCRANADNIWSYLMSFFPSWRGLPLIGCITRFKIVARRLKRFLYKECLTQMRTNRFLAYSESIRLFVCNVEVSGKVYIACRSLIREVDSRFDDLFRALVYLHVAYKIRITETEEMYGIIDALAAIAGFYEWPGNDVCAVFANAVRKSWEVSSSDTIEFHLCEAYLTRVQRCTVHFDCSSANIHLALLYYNTAQYRSCADQCKLVVGQQFCRSSDASNFVDVNSISAHQLDQFCNILGLIQLLQLLEVRLFKHPQIMRCVFDPDLFLHCLRIHALWLIKHPSVGDLELSQAAREYSLCFSQATDPSVCDFLLYRQCIGIRDSSGTNAAIRITAGQSPSAHREWDHGDVSFAKLLVDHASQFLTTTIGRFSVEISQLHILHSSVVRSIALYKFGSYERCLHLCREVLCSINLSDHCRMMQLPTDPPYPEMFDDDFCSLIGLAMIVDPEIRFSIRESFGLTGVRQHLVALYLVLQCMMKLSFPVADVVAQLRQLKLAVGVNCECLEIFGRIVVCFIYRKTIRYVERRQRYSNC